MTKRINLVLLKNKNQFPAADNTFDQVYAESIIAIQEDKDFRELLTEIKRVLKPNGRLLFNETIWLETTDRKKAEHINEECIKSFGIIQSNHTYLHLTDWKILLTEMGFEVELEMKVSEIRPLREKKYKTYFRSNIFTFLGKTKAYLSLSMRLRWKNFQQKMDSIHKSKEPLMEGIIIKAINKR
jgi:ubiquinone/menaquinone biosynthesis C-methylase UbiE